MQSGLLVIERPERIPMHTVLVYAGRVPSTHGGARSVRITRPGVADGNPVPGYGRKSNYRGSHVN